MKFNPSKFRYGRTAQLLHWLTAILVIIAWALGTFDDLLPKGAGRAGGLFIHMSVGLAILVLLFIRIPWQVSHKATPEPTNFGRWMGWSDPAARIAHYGLYLLLAAVPISGILLQFARGGAVPVFGIAEIPSLWIANRAFSGNIKEVHEITAHMLVILASFHAVAALLHHFIFRDRTLIRMLPPPDANRTL